MIEYIPATVVLGHLPKVLVPNRNADATDKYRPKIATMRAAQKSEIIVPMPRSFPSLTTSPPTTRSISPKPTLL